MFVTERLGIDSHTGSLEREVKALLYKYFVCKVHLVHDPLTDGHPFDGGDFAVAMDGCWWWQQQ